MVQYQIQLQVIMIAQRLGRTDNWMNDHSYQSRVSVSFSLCLFFWEVILLAQLATISPTLLVISLVSSLLMNFLYRQMPSPITRISENIVTRRMITTWLFVLLAGTSTSTVLVAQYLGGVMRLEQMASVSSSASRLPRQIMLLMATSGKLSKPRRVSLVLQVARVAMGSTLQTSSMFIFLRMDLVHWSMLFQSPSQYLSKRFMYSSHFSGPLWWKMAIWCSSSLMIFCPTLYWLFSQSKQQYSLRQQLSWWQFWQLIVWQIGYIVTCDFSCEYYFLNQRKKIQVLRLEAEMKSDTVADASCGTGKFAMISTLFSFCSFQKDLLVMWRQVMCTFFPFPSSDSMTLPLEQSARGEAITIPFAPMACAFSALFVQEQASMLLVLMTRQVGFWRCSRSAGVPQRESWETTTSKLNVLPQGISPKLAQKQSMVLLGKSVRRGVVMTKVECDMARQTASMMILTSI